jgi:calcium-dependent protein kinase
MDSNHDGKVDFQEFIAAAIHRDIAFQKQHIFTTFKLFDINGDGRISIDELKAVF